MLEIANGRKVAILIDDESAVIKAEDKLRLIWFTIDYAKREAIAVFKKGFTDANQSFHSQDLENVVVEIKDLPERVETYFDNDTQTLRQKTLPPLPLFTNLITPKAKDAKWVGDVSQLDIEALIIDHDLLDKINIVDIVSQV